HHRGRGCPQRVGGALGRGQQHRDRLDHHHPGDGIHRGAVLCAVGNCGLTDGSYSGITLERDAFSSNRHLALAYWRRMIFSENRYPLFGIMRYTRVEQGPKMTMAETSPAIR